MSQALVLIDLQNDYFPGGSMELVRASLAVEKAAEVLAQFRKDGKPIVHIQHVMARPGATFFLPNTPGVEIHEAVRPIDGEPIFVKHYPNSFRETPLLEHLRGLEATEITVVGMMTHMCVDTTVRAAFDLGFKVTLVGSACATRDLAYDGKTVSAANVQTAYLAALNGLFATVI